MTRRTIIKCGVCGREMFWVVDDTDPKKPKRFLVDMHVPTFQQRPDGDNPLTDEPFVRKVADSWVPHAICCPATCAPAGKELAAKIAARKAAK